MPNLTINDYQWHFGRSKAVLGAQAPETPSNVPVLKCQEWTVFNKDFTALIGDKKIIDTLFGKLEQAANGDFGKGIIGSKGQAALSLISAAVSVGLALDLGGASSFIINTAKTGGVEKGTQILSNVFGDKHIKPASRIEIPFFGKNIFSRDSKSGWNGQGLEAISSHAEVLKKRYGINVPLQPFWTQEASNGVQIDTEFVLINYNEASAKKNLELLGVLIGSTLYTQEGYFQRPPSIWTITAPGGSLAEYVIKFAALDLKVSPEGAYIKGNVPELYRVSCTFTDLLPSSKNLFAEGGSEVQNAIKEGL